MPGIEFIGADTDDPSDDETLDVGPRRPVPRWVWVVAALAVVALGVGVLVSSRAKHTPNARPSTPAPTTAAPTDPAPVQQISALTSDGTSLYWVVGNQLFRAGPVGRASMSTTISPTGGDFAELQLVPDPAENTLWVVSRGSADSSGGAGDVEGFRTTDLTRVTRRSAPSLIGGAAAYNGALYVLSSGRLLRITARAGGFTRMASVDADAQDLVARGDSLYYVEGGRGDAVGRWTPAAGVRPRVALDTTDSSLAAVGSTVFVAGTRRGQDVLDTLEPVGAGGRPDPHAVPIGLTGDLQLVATGSKSLVVLGSRGRGLQFACVVGDHPNGERASVQALAVAASANVAVLRDDVFQAVGDTVRPVDFYTGTCPG